MTPLAVQHHRARQLELPMTDQNRRVGDLAYGASITGRAN